jgi:hypothetical protein
VQVALLYPRRGMELLNCMEVLFLVFEESPYCFHSGCTSLHSHQHGIEFLFLYFHASNCCCLCYWWQLFWLEWGGFSMLFWFAFALWPRPLSISSFTNWPFALLHLRIVHSVHFPTYLVGCSFFVKLKIFWAPCISWY